MWGSCWIKKNIQIIGLALDSAKKYSYFLFFKGLKLKETTIENCKEKNVALFIFEGKKRRNQT